MLLSSLKAEASSLSEVLQISAACRRVSLRSFTDVCPGLLQPPACCPVSLRIRTDYHTAASASPGWVEKSGLHTTHNCSCSSAQIQGGCFDTPVCEPALVLQLSKHASPAEEGGSFIPSHVDPEGIHLADCQDGQTNTAHGSVCPPAPTEAPLTTAV